MYLNRAKMVLKWLKRVLCDNKMTRQTHLRVSVTTRDVLAGKQVISGLDGCRDRVGRVKNHTLTKFQLDRSTLIFHAASE